MMRVRVMVMVMVMVVMVMVVMMVVMVVMMVMMRRGDLDGVRIAKPRALLGVGGLAQQPHFVL